jgi:hypothetical protein
MNERLFGETPTAMAMVAIRRRDPTFSLPDFMTDVQEDVRPVLLAYLGGDLKTLSELCADEVVQRARAERKAFDALGVTQESKVRAGAFCIHPLFVSVFSPRLWRLEKVRAVCGRGGSAGPSREKSCRCFAKST